MSAPTRRLLGPTVVALLVGAGGAFLSFGRVWARATVDGSGLPDSKVSVTGTAAHGGAAALALVAAVSALAVLAASARVRRWIGVLATVCAGGSMGYVLAGGAAMSRQQKAAVAQVTGTARQWHHTVWEPVALAGLLLAVCAGLLVAVAGPSWPTMGRRYDAPGKRAEPSGDDMWTSLDKGEDPTG